MPGTTHAEVEISVIDDGAGMPADLAAAPFEPAGRRRDRSSGAGLGLSIAKGIVDAHGGRIALQCLRKGTCFRVYLPVEAAERPGGEAELKGGGPGGEAVTVAADAGAAGGSKPGHGSDV